MKHIMFHENPNNEYEIALLIKESAFAKILLEEHYIKPLTDKGINPSSIIALSLTYNDNNKAPVTLIKDSLQTVLKSCVQLRTTTLLVADSAYFKVLTKERTSEPHHGSIKKCAIEGYEHISVILSVNYQSFLHNPDMKQRLDMSIDTLVAHMKGIPKILGAGIIHDARYPERTHEIKEEIENLHNYAMLACDVETFGLDINTCGLATIAFAWSQHEGVAFNVDLGPTDEVKMYLRNFFERYQGKLMFHNGTFDIKVLIKALFMEDPLDNAGVIHGLEVMYRDIHDTKIITYLATNNAQGNKLSLKHNAFEFAGNYAIEDIKNIRAVPNQDLLEYNLVDCLSTWFVYSKWYPVMIMDNQLDIYNEIFLPSMKVITHMELTGMPMNAVAISNARLELSTTLNFHLHNLHQSQAIKNLEWNIQTEEMVKANLLLKKKVKPREDFKISFNPASTKQVRKLLYEQFGYEVTDLTDTGLPSVGGKTLQKYLKKLMSEHNIKEEDLE